MAFHHSLLELFQLSQVHLLSIKHLVKNNEDDPNEENYPASRT